MTKHFCDGCGDEVAAYASRLKLEPGAPNPAVNMDLCGPCGHALAWRIELFRRERKGVQV